MVIQQDYLKTMYFNRIVAATNVTIRFGITTFIASSHIQSWYVLLQTPPHRLCRSLDFSHKEFSKRVVKDMIYTESVSPNLSH
jgi:hypothetical protein